jgi:hypothetical protein
MSAKRYTDEFEAEVVKQVTERGHPVAEPISVNQTISDRSYDELPELHSYATTPTIAPTPPVFSLLRAGFFPCAQCV